MQNLEAQLRKERKDLQKEFDSDREATRQEWLIIILFSALIYGILKATKVW